MLFVYAAFSISRPKATTPLNIRCTCADLAQLCARANAIKTGEFDVVLVPLNLINRETTEELLPLAKEVDVGIVTVKPFGGMDYCFVRQEWWGTYVQDKTEFNQIFGEGIFKIERALKFVLAHPILP